MEAGGPSSQQPPPPEGDPPASPPRAAAAPSRGRNPSRGSRFTSKANQDWYNKRKGTKLIVEKTIDPEIEQQVQVGQYFNRLGWDPVMNMSGPFYPGLVKEFYANIGEKDTLQLWNIDTSVRGKPIRVTEATIAAALGMELQGVRWVEGDGYVQHDPGFKSSQAAAALGITPTPVARGPLLLTAYLSVQERLFVYLLAANVFPHVSSTNKLRTPDIYFLHRARFGPWTDKVSLPSILLSGMRDVVRLSNINFRFPILISRILQRADVVLDSDVPSLPDVSHIFTSSNLRKMKFISVQGVWRNKRVKSLHPGEVADHQRRAAPAQPRDDNAEIAAQERGGGEAAPEPPVSTRTLLGQILEKQNELQRDMRAQAKELRRQGRILQRLKDTFLPETDDSDDGSGDSSSASF